MFDIDTIPVIAGALFYNNYGGGTDQTMNIIKVLVKLAGYTRLHSKV